MSKETLTKSKSKKEKKRDTGDLTTKHDTIPNDAPTTEEAKSDKKKRRREEGSADFGTSLTISDKGNIGHLETKTERKDKKKKDKKAKSEAAKVAADEAENPRDAVAVDESCTQTVIGDGTQEKRKKKRKRDEITPADGAEESNEKRRKKKRQGESVEDGNADSSEAASQEGKKEKKSKNSSGNEAVSTPNPTSIPLPSPEAVDAYLTKHSVTIHVPEGTSTGIPVLSFAQLAVPEGIRKAFEGFSEPTPIQACAWPYAMEGKDVVGIAETGSGKTLAFGIPALSQLMKAQKHTTGGVSILVVAPTRELAVQTHETLSELGKPFNIASVAVFGGVPKEGQIKLLKNAGVAGGKTKKSGGLITKIVVGTPGRILDLAGEGMCDLSGVDYLVLDEADRMLDKGFENDIRKIIEQTRPKAERQTMMFSATWPEAVRRLASTFQRDPVRVTVGSDDLTANSRVEQTVEVFDDARSKDSRLLNLLKSLGHKKSSTSSRILVFALYKKEASRVESMLQRQGYTVGALHGDMSQNARMDALDNFKNGKTGLLVATDVAARGLDIPNVEVVINYTFPLTIEDYIHRIGRTGRGGKSGKSITFFTGDNHERGLAGELARVLREGGFDYEALKKFPMTIKKKEHSVYGAFYRDDIPVPKGPTKIVF